MHPSHGCEAFRPGATQQLQQKRLGLIVPMMGGKEKVRVQRSKNTLALAPRRGLDTGWVVARDLHAMNGQFNAVCCTQPFTEISPVVRMRRQAVMYMHGLEFERMVVAQRKKRMQQDD